MESILVPVRLLHFGSALLMVSLLYFWRVTWRPDPSSPLLNALFSRRILRCLWLALVVQAVSGLLWLWIAAAGMSGNSMGDSLKAGVVETVLFHTRFGWLWLARGVLTLGFVGTFLSRWTFWSLAVGVGLLVSLAWAGHAGAGRSAVHLGADVMHLAAGAIWPGGLFPLALFLFTLAKNQRRPSPENLFILRRFSDASLLAVLFIFGTGMVNAWFLLPRMSALFLSSYGWLLAGKIALFLIMVGIGFMNRFLFLPKMSVSFSGPGWLFFQRLVIIENILTLGILWIVSIMGMTAPPI